MEKEEKEKKQSNWWKYAIILLILILIVILLLLSCGKGKDKYKIKLHYGDEVIEVDENFDLKDLEVEGGKVSFLVSSDGYVVEPGSKLEKEKEYSGHLIPEGKEKVKVTYKWNDKSLTIEYQKGAGLLFPEDPKKPGTVFIGWQDESTKEFPKVMTPVMQDMTLVAKFGKKISSACLLNCDTNGDGKCDANCDTNGDGKADSKLTPSGEEVCTLNCDTNNDGKCDVNCDVDEDGTPDHNIDTDGDGKPDLNIKSNENQMCTLNCDTNGDGKPDTNVDTNGDEIPDTNIDTDGDGIPDTNIDTNGDGKCDKDCVDGVALSTVESYPNHYYSCHSSGAFCWKRPSWTVVYLKFDGKEVELPKEYTKITDFVEKVYDYSYLLGSGKTVEIEYMLIETDDTGQKYYHIYYATATFKGNCDNKINEITYKCEDYDIDGGFFFTSPVKKDQVKSIKIEGNVEEPDNYKDDYPVYKLDTYFEDGKTIYIEMEYTSPDSNGNTKYSAKVVFPVCEFGVTEYTLNLDPNGGSVNPTSLRYIVGQVIYNLPFPTRSGYQFVGWYTEKNGGELVSDDTDTTMPEHDMTIYAHWESNDTPKTTYTLTYNANGGSVSPKSKTLNEGEKYGNLPIPTRSGYRFDGWYTKSSGGNKVTSSTKIKGNTTIYAHWTKIEEQTPTPTPQEDTADHGTIQLLAPNTCLYPGKQVRVSASVSNAKDSSVYWTNSSCLSLSGSGETRTVSGMGCGAHPTITGTLVNGAKDTVTFDYEDKLTVTVTTRNGSEAEYYEGRYLGNDLTISTNIPAYITGNSLLGNASELRTSAQTNGPAQTTVTITTPCGQTKTIKTYPIIN